MKKYITLSLSLLFATGMYAQKNEIKAIKKILDKKAPTEAEYKELQGLIDATGPYIGNGTPEEQAEFYFYKGNYENKKFSLTGNPDALSIAVNSYMKTLQIEENSKKKPFTDKLHKDIFPVLKPQALQKAIDFSNNKKHREATNIFKYIYDLEKDQLYLYYAASTALNIPDYNMSLEYYQELLDKNFTGEVEYYTAKNKATGEIESFGGNKTLMDIAVKSGEYSHPKKEEEKSKRPEILKNMVLIYTSVNQASRAENLLSEARKESPDDLQLMMVQANFYLKNKETEKFENLMKEAISKDPNNPDLYFNLGVTSADAGNTEKAKEYYNKTIQLDSKYVNAHINLGVLLLKDEEKIIEQMNAITGYTAADNKKYESLKQERDRILKNAIPHLERALAIEPDNEFAISNLAGIYGALDMTDKQNEYNSKLKN